MSKEEPLISQFPFSADFDLLRRAEKLCGEEKKVCKREGFLSLFSSLQVHGSFALLFFVVYWLLAANLEHVAEAKLCMVSLPSLPLPSFFRRGQARRSAVGRQSVQSLFKARCQPVNRGQFVKAAAVEAAAAWNKKKERKEGRKQRVWGCTTQAGTSLRQHIISLFPFELERPRV